MELIWCHRLQLTDWPESDVNQSERLSLKNQIDLFKTSAEEEGDLDSAISAENAESFMTLFLFYLLVCGKLRATTQ